MSTGVEFETASGSKASAGRSGLRLLVRVVCLVAAVAALWPVAPSVNSSGWVDSLSPFVAVSSVIARRAFHALAWLGLAVGAAVFTRHRLFCRWICPVGLCADGTSWVGRRLKRRPMRGPLTGRWIVWVTFGGALLGYPFLLWLDPLAVFAGAISAMKEHSNVTMLLPVTGLVVVAILSLMWPGSWCGIMCPLGALQDLLSAVRRFVMGRRRRKSDAERASRVDSRVTRRAVLGLGIGATCAWATKPARAKRPGVLRPPGARGEDEFVGLCTRCGNCVGACPSGIIERDMGQSGWTGFLTPVLTFEKDYCREDCVRCMQVCPSGALGRLSLDEKAGMKLGLPVVDMNLCLLGEDRDCSACKRWCPYDAIRYVFSETEYALKPQIDIEKCTGCGACEAACPTKPRKAIVVEVV